MSSVATNKVLNLKTGVQPTSETSCISNTPQAMGIIEHNIRIMNQALSHTFREHI